jgi:hypothetical protein
MASGALVRAVLRFSSERRHLNLDVHIGQSAPVQVRPLRRRLLRARPRQGRPGEAALGSQHGLIRQCIQAVKKPRTSVYFFPTLHRP